MGNKVSIQSPKKAPAKLKRGIHANVDELRAWYETKSFKDLNKRGQEAFFRFLRGDIYDEELDVISVPVGAENVDGNAKRYQFWLKCENIKLEELFDDYIMDDTNKIQDAKESYTEKEKLKNHAAKTEEYVNKLKGSMESDLNEEFSKFTKFLEEEFKRSMET